MKALLLAGSVLLAALTWISGPPSFDAVDGAQFALAGHRLEIAHAPGYPLFLWLLRIGSMITGPLYSHIRMVTCLIAGACLPAAWAALRSRGVSSPGSLISAVFLLSMPPVFSQLNVLEVHGTAMMLLFTAIALRKSRIGPFLASMAVFGGHPVSLLAMPLAFSRRWLSRWALLAVIPGSLLLYLPLRAPGSSVAHYTAPSTLPHAAAYYSMHSHRLGPPSADGLLAFASSLGIVCSAALLILIFRAGSPPRKALVSGLLGLVFLSIYRVPDYESFAWFALVPFLFIGASGVDGFLRGQPAGRLAPVMLILPCLYIGITDSWRAGDDAAPRYTRDILASLPPGAVLHTQGHSTFYTAYMVFNEGMRPDIIPADGTGNFFFLNLESPLPDSVGGRPVYATRAWNNPNLVLSGILFGPVIAEVDWASLEIFGYEGTSPDAMAGDVAAEAWALRMVQSSGEEREFALGRALRFAQTTTTRNRVEQLFHLFP